jgi:hypothetical protein
VSERSLLLPPGARLLHIGFPKTGTSALQTSLQAARDRLPDLGVVYPGTGRYHRSASIAAIGVKPRIGDRKPHPRNWQTLVDQVKEAGDRRVIISSEWFCEADDEAAQRIVDGLGGDSVHLVVTLRPLTKILPSSWQQYVQNGLRKPYDGWLRGMLLEPPYDRPTATFWRRHRHDEVIARWAKIVGSDRVTALVVDESDPAFLLRQFEQLSGLPDGTLELQPRTNASMSRPQTELVRRLNQAFREREWPDGLYHDVIRKGVAEHVPHGLERSAPGVPIVTPQWALERAGEIGAAAAREIAASGVRVVGDLDVLGRVPEPRDVEDWDGDCVSLEDAGQALTGAIEAARRYGRKEAEREHAVAEAARQRREQQEQQERRERRPDVRLRRLAGRVRRRLRAEVGRQSQLLRRKKT